MAQRIGNDAQRVVGNIIFQGVGDTVVILTLHGHVAQTHIVVVVGAQRIVLTRCGCALTHGLIGEIHVESAQSLQPGIHHDGYGRIALHRIGLAAVELPFGQPSVLAVHGEHRIQHIGLHVGPQQRDELVQVAVGVPKRKHGIAVAAGAANAVRLHHRILSVAVLENVRMD